MRPAWALALLASTAVLAGCLDGGADAAQDITTETDAMEMRHSHPAYGFPVNLGLGETPLAALPPDWTLTPARELPDEITGLEVVKELAGPPSGAGIGLFGHYAYVGAWNNEHFAVVDVADPANPVVVGETDSLSGDVDIVAYPDGRLIAVTATRGNFINVIEVTDPTAPTLLTSIEVTTTNHNLAVLPGTPLVYNAGSSVDIWDLTDPANPVLANVFEQGGEGGSCHDIEFFIDRDRDHYRGICAGYGATELWDVTDPIEPVVVNKIPYPSLEQGLPVVGDGSTLPDLGQQGAGFSHLAVVNHDASILIVGDETGGGAAPGCDFYVQGMSGPLGNIWFYDITDEADPQLLSHLSVNAFEAYGSCTAHFGRVIADTDHMVVAYYTAGVILVDFTDPANPFIEDRWNGKQPTEACTLCGTWDAQYHQGYVFTGDISRGMDILTLI